MRLRLFAEQLWWVPVCAGTQDAGFAVNCRARRRRRETRRWAGLPWS